MDTHTKSSSGVAWIALIVAIIALIVAWMAYNRIGTDLEEIIRQEFNQATASLEANFQQLETEVRQEAASGLNEAAQDISTDE